MQAARKENKNKEIKGDRVQNYFNPPPSLSLFLSLPLSLFLSLHQAKMNLFVRPPYTRLSSSFPVVTTTTTTTTVNSKMIAANKRKMHSNRSSSSVLACKASSSSSSSSSWMMELDLYDLLGVDSSSDHSQIKSAYRALQKRCHPDIAGPTGHDMSIILNEAYALLSDPISRLLYDKEQSKLSELRGYSGKPIYSVWLGSESEERAVFVDEVKCIGCLKCALLAEKTFAVESVYGRARVVAQWADSEQKIQEAIDACPIDCISMVERSDLAALEYLMSKQPRGNVRVGAGNIGGTCVSNIFVDMLKFQKRFQDAMDKAPSAQSTVAPSSQRKARSAAIQTIRSISNWMYWQSPNSSSEANTNLTTISGRRSSSPGSFSKLREAVAARKRVIANRTQIPPWNSMCGDDYWVPSTLGLPQARWDLYCSEEAAAKDQASTEENSSATTREAIYVQERQQKEAKRKSSFGSIVPVVTAMIAGAIVQFQIEQGGRSNSSPLEDHIAGSFALGIVNSTWLQVILAGITWYLISTYAIEVVGAFTSKVGLYKK